MRINWPVYLVGMSVSALLYLAITDWIGIINLEAIIIGMLSVPAIYTILYFCLNFLLTRKDKLDDINSL